MNQKSLKKQIVVYGIFSFVMMCLFSISIYFVGRYLSVKQLMDSQASRLAASAPSQAEQILPGLLLPEEYGAIKLQLHRIKDRENLSKIQFIKAPNDSLSRFLACPKSGVEPTFICASYFKEQIIAATPVGFSNKLLGYLVKYKNISKPKIYNPVLFLLGTLLGGIVLIFFGLIISILLFVERAVRKPLLNLNQNLSPILDGTMSTTFSPLIMVEELQFLSGQVEQLVRKYEEKKAAALVGDLAAQVAHDIRSPLAALDSVLKDLSQLPEDKRLLVRSAVGRIRDIANGLIEKNRGIQARTRGVSPSLESERPSVQLLSALMDPLITEKRSQYRSQTGVVIDFRMEEAAYGIFAEAQPTELKRVLSNLINNAVEALGERGFVVVTLGSSQDQASIQIQDDGRGISPEILARLGQKGETHGKAGGSGLGIYHARADLKSWNGSLEIQSELGKGTTAIIKLPKAPAPEWFVSRLILSPGKPVVILDDDFSIHQVWRGRLESLRARSERIEIFDFSGPAEFRAWTKSHAEKSADALYLMDYELLGHRETGLDLAEDLGLGEKTILVTSRYEEPGILERCLRLKVRMIPKTLAAYVPIDVDIKSRDLDAILIDDDALVRKTWEIAARQAGKKLAVFSSPRDFLNESRHFPLETPLYIDSHLGDGLKGEEESKRIYEMGYRNIFLATGSEPESFPPMDWIKKVVGKEAPWM